MYKNIKYGDLTDNTPTLTFTNISKGKSTLSKGEIETMRCMLEGHNTEASEDVAKMLGDFYREFRDSHHLFGKLFAKKIKGECASAIPDNAIFVKSKQIGDNRMYASKEDLKAIADAVSAEMSEEEGSSIAQKHAMILLARATVPFPEDIVSFDVFGTTVIVYDEKLSFDMIRDAYRAILLQDGTAA